VASIAELDELKVGPNLRPLVVSNEFLARTAVFERKDAEALAEQRSLFRLLDAISRIILVIAILSGIVLATSLVRAEPDLLKNWIGSDRAGQWSNWIETASRWLAAVVGGLTLAVTVLGQLARDGDRLGRWRTLRADAEAARAGRFTSLARSAAAAGKDTAREALEFVRLGLLENQRRWYVSRAGRHRQSVGVTSFYTIVALLLSAAASAAALTVSFTGVYQAMLVVGVLAAAFTAYAVDRENLYRDRSNATLYAKTAEELEALAAGSDTVLAEIDRGSPEAVVAFTDLLAEKLQTEHRQWTAGLDVTAELLTRLDQRLQQARAANAKAGSGVSPPLTDGASAAAGPTIAGAGNGAPPDSTARTVPAVSDPPSSIAANVRQWQPMLAAAANVLPPPQGDRARVLLDQLPSILTPLDAAAPASDAIGRAADFANLLKSDNPLGQWFRSTAPVLGTVLPPLGLVLGIAGVGAKLGEAAYRRWVSSVLQTPFSPGLVEPEHIDSTVVLAALEVSPIFSAAFAEEQGVGNLAFLSQVGKLVLGDPDQLWLAHSAKFAGDRGRFDQGVEEMRRALLNDAVAADVASLSAGGLPADVTPQGIVDAARKLNENAQSRAALQTTVLLQHELRSEGVADPAAALRTALAGA
jgi:SMODS and SLOG-associating 2TM effector domain 1